MPSRLSSVLHSAVTAYCIVTLAFLLGIVHVQEIETRSCHSTEKSWRVATAIIAAQTRPSKSITTDTNLAAQINSSNERKRNQRLSLTAQLGARPSC